MLPNISATAASHLQTALQPVLPPSLSLSSAHASGSQEANDLVGLLNTLCRMLGFSIQIIALWRDAPSTRHRSEPAANFHAIKRAVTITTDHSTENEFLPTKIEMRVENIEMPCEYLLMPNDTKYLLRAITTARNAMTAWKNSGLDVTRTFRQALASDQEIDDLKNLLAQAGRSAAAIYAQHIAEGGTMEPEDTHFVMALLHRYGPHRYLDQQPCLALARHYLNAGDFSLRENETDVYDLALVECALGKFQGYLGWPLLITQHQPDGTTAHAASSPSLLEPIGNVFLVVRINFYSQGAGLAFSVTHLKTMDSCSTGLILLAPDDDKPLCRAVATARLLLDNWHEYPQAAGDIETDGLQQLLAAP